MPFLRGPSVMAPVLLATVLMPLTGCVSSMNPIYDEPDQAVAFDRLVGDWAMTGAHVRIQPAEIDGIPGYRAVGVRVAGDDAEADPSAEGEPPQPDVVAFDIVVGSIGEDLIAQVRFDRDLNEQIAPEFPWEQLVEPDQPTIGFYRLNWDTPDDRIIFQQLNYLVIDELVDIAPDPPAFRTVARHHISLNDEPARVRDFLADYADDLWGEEGQAIMPVETVPAAQDQQLERYFEQLSPATD